MTLNWRNTGINRRGKEDPQDARLRLLEELEIYESLNRVRDQRALQVGFQRLRLRADKMKLDKAHKLLAKGQSSQILSKEPVKVEQDGKQPAEFSDSANKHLD